MWITTLHTYMNNNNSLYVHRWYLSYINEQQLFIHMSISTLHTYINVSSLRRDRTQRLWKIVEESHLILRGHTASIDRWCVYVCVYVCLCLRRDRTQRLWKIVEESHLILRGHTASIDCVAMSTEDWFCGGSQVFSFFLFFLFFLLQSVYMYIYIYIYVYMYIYVYIYIIYMPYGQFLYWKWTLRPYNGTHFTAPFASFVQKGYFNRTETFR